MWKTLYTTHVNYDKDNNVIGTTTRNESTGKVVGSKKYGWWGSSSNSWWGSTSNDWATKYANNAAYQNMVKQYWADKVHSALDYINWWGKDSSVTQSILWWGVKWWISSSNQSWDLSWYTTASIENYNNAINHYKSQWMDDDSAKKQASAFLETWTLWSWKTKEEEAAEYSWGYDDDNDEEYIDAAEEYYDPYEDSIWGYDEDALNRIENTVNDFVNSYDNQQTTETKAETSHDPIFDYNTYFQNNIVWDTANVWTTGQQAEQPAPSTELTDVTSDIEWVTQSLQNLGFLEPNGQASASMPWTEEQADVKTYENPESIVDDFNQQIQSYVDWWTWLSAQAALQTYKDFRWQLQKFRDENKLSDEEYNEFLKQLQSNEDLRNALTKSNINK